MKPRLLVVEDETHIRRIIASTLEDSGYAVEVAGDGVEAWTRLTGDGPVIDLVVTDLSMPNMDGLELLLRRVQRLDASSRPACIVLTAVGRPVDHARAIELGASRVLTKPFLPPLIIDAVKALVGATR